MSYEYSTTGEIFEWRGPAPFTFVAIDPKQSKEIKSRSAMFTYGWGVLYIHGLLGKTEFSTTLFPKDGVYYIPIKVAVKKAEGVDLGDKVTIKFNLGQKS